MDVEYQYETFNGPPVYYGGDMYDSEDTEEYDPLEMARAAYVEDYNFDVPEGMELMMYTRRRLDGGDARGVNAIDMVPMGRTVSGVARYEPDESSDTLKTDTAELEESDIEDCGLWTDLWEEEDFLYSLLDRLWTIVYVFQANKCRATWMLHLWVILIVKTLMMLLVLIRMWAPGRSWNGTRGTTHTRGSLGMRLGIFRRTQL